MSHGVLLCWCNAGGLLDMWCESRLFFVCNDEMTVGDASDYSGKVMCGSGLYLHDFFLKDMMKT